MEALLTGIYNVWLTTNAFRTACTGGLHFEQAPQGTSLPYATYQIVTGRPEYHFSETHEIANVQFDIYSATNASRQDLYTKLTALFDDVRPTVTGYTSIIMERIFQQPWRAGEQEEVFRYTVEYSGEIQKT